jgi:hypothetical protein
MANWKKSPSDWVPDIERSVADYNDWYLSHSPDMWAVARGKAVEEAAQAMTATNDFRDLGPPALRARPGALFVVRMAVSPTMARDRFVGFSGANKSLVTRMERDGVLPPRVRNLDGELLKMCSFMEPLIDPGLFPWLADGRAPTEEERDKALLVLGERLAKAFYDPTLRNAQEARQKVEMRAFLESHGFTESSATAFELAPGTFGFGRNVPAVRADGERQNLPVDCVVAPLDGDLPLACVELKSAGDFTNVNKRRKEEADKHEALRRSHGDKVVFLLQLFGYFDRGYLGFEASAGIDWAWDHRLDDFLPYLRI